MSAWRNKRSFKLVAMNSEIEHDGLKENLAEIGQEF